MKLYYSPGACSLSPHIVLREAGLDFDLEQVDLATKKTKGGADYFAIAPKGLVPALALDTGELLTEGPAIVQYLADKTPASKLAPPAGSRERYKVQEWLNYITTELHKGFSPLWKANTPDAYKPIVKDSLTKQFAYVDKQLAGKSYLTGETFTVADAYLFTIMSWAKFHNLDLAAYPNLNAFMTRVAARPRVHEALKAEGLVKAAA